MSAHVACDPTGAVNRTWMQQAGVLGIPFVFVVNADSEIAWMGSPEMLSTALPAILNQKILPPEELMRATLVQHASLQTMRTRERWNEAQRYRTEVINSLVNKGRHAEAVDAIDKARETYRDFPEFVDDLRTFKLYELARVPGACEAASALALNMAAEHYNNKDAGLG